MNRWKVGDVTITRVVEAEELWDGTLLLPGATADAVKKERGLFPAFTTEEGQFRLSIHAFILESQGKRIIVDTCVGNDKSRSIPQWDHLHGPFPERLIEAGHPREAIDRVICTHLHLDHVGWNTMLVNDKWTATFPNAKYLVHGTEWDFFSKTEDEFLKGPVEDSVRPVMSERVGVCTDRRTEADDQSVEVVALEARVIQGGADRLRGEIDRATL